MLALQGHCENNIASGSNLGIFNALLDFRIDASDVIFKEHFKILHVTNAQYNSPQI